jgi:hypothetical protein
MNGREIVLIANIFLLASTLSACRDKGRIEMNADGSAESLDSLGKELDLTFPVSARLLGVERESGMDDMVRLKVEMNAADLAGFLERSPIDPASFRSGPRGFLGQDRGFWDPHRAAQLRTAQAIVAGHRALNIGVDETRAGVVTLYIVNHGT